MFWKTYDLHALARPVLRGNTNKRNIIRNTGFWKEKKSLLYLTTQFISINQKHFNQIQVVTNEIINITCKLKFTVITEFKNINSLYKGSVLDAILQNNLVIVFSPHKYTSIIAYQNHLINHFKAFLSPKCNTWDIAFITLWPTRSKSS